MPTGLLARKTWRKKCADGDAAADALPGRHSRVLPHRILLEWRHGQERCKERSGSLKLDENRGNFSSKRRPHGSREDCADAFCPSPSARSRTPATQSISSVPGGFEAAAVGEGDADVPGGLGKLCRLGNADWRSGVGPPKPTRMTRSDAIPLLIPPKACVKARP